MFPAWKLPVPGMMSGDDQDDDDDNAPNTYPINDLKNTADPDDDPDLKKALEESLMMLNIDNQKPNKQVSCLT